MLEAAPRLAWDSPRDPRQQPAPPPRKPPKDGRLPGQGLPTDPDAAAPPPRAAVAEPVTEPDENLGTDPIFLDGAAATGLDFVHHNGSDGRYLFAEVIGSGAALFDYDGDGDLDLFLVQGTVFPDSPRPTAGTNSTLGEKSVSGKRDTPDEPPATDGPRMSAAPVASMSDSSDSSGSERDIPARSDSAANSAANSGPNSGSDSNREPSESVQPEMRPLGDRLFRNLLVETGELSFEDVTQASGLDSARGAAYGMGVAVGDFDGDGDPDLYVTALGSNRLWRNQGDGTFQNATLEARADDPRWSTAASFLDADLDGDLDLWVGNYVDWSVERDQVCRAVAGYRDFCGPLSYPPVPDRLLENLGDGRFADASSRTRLRLTHGAALGGLVLDLGGDPRPEILVANDASANQLWVPSPPAAGSTGFTSTLLRPWRDEGLESGVALNGHGRPEGSMGIDAGDFDEDGDLDLFVTHVHRETNTLYRNQGDGSFLDATEAAGLAAPSLGMTGFGTAFLDYDNDGWLDVLVVNGTVTVIPELTAAGDPFPLDQPDQLFRNLGRGDTPASSGSSAVRFLNVSAVGGEALASHRVSRGAAFGDLDNDGDTDVLINDSGSPARLLLNQVGQDAHWLGLHLRQPAVDGALTEAPGARVTLHLPSGRRLLRHVRLDGSYLAAHDPRLLFGLGNEEFALTAHVRWPDGSEETFPLQDLPIGSYHSLTRGTGTQDSP